MKKIKMILPMLIIAAAAFTAFAFKPATTATLSEGWYVLNPLGDEQDPNDYSFDPSYDPQTQCQGSVKVCAIRAEGDGVSPAFTYGNLNNDADVKEIAHKNQ